MSQPILQKDRGTECDENTGAAAFCSKNKNRGILCVPCIPCKKIVIRVNPHPLRVP